MPGPDDLFSEEERSLQRPSGSRQRRSIGSSTGATHDRRGPSYQDSTTPPGSPEPRLKLTASPFVSPRRRQGWSTTDGAESDASTSSQLTSASQSSPGLAYTRQRDAIRPIWQRKARESSRRAMEDAGPEYEPSARAVSNASGSARTRQSHQPSSAAGESASDPFRNEQSFRLPPDPAESYLSRHSARVRRAGRGSEEHAEEERPRARTSLRDPSSSLTLQSTLAASRSTSLAAAVARAAQRRASQVTAEPESESDYEALRRERREQRDRMIRERIQQKRSGPGTANANEADSTLQPARRFAQDLERLNNRISRPPSASSVAAFAATVSPSKRNVARTRELSSGYAGSVSPTKENFASDASRTPKLMVVTSSPSPRVLELPSDHSDQRANASDAQRLSSPTRSGRQTQATAPSPIASSASEPPSPSGFSFVPQKMSKELASPADSDASGSSRRAGHRRTQTGSSVVNVSARLPPRSAIEAQRRLQSALGSGTVDVDVEVEIKDDRGGNASALRASRLGAEESVGNATSVSRKSVRFSPLPETIGGPDQVAETSLENGSDDGQLLAEEAADETAVADADSLGPSDDGEDGEDSSSQISRDSQEQDPDLAAQISTAVPVSRFEGRSAGTPVKLPPGALPPGSFGTPAVGTAFRGNLESPASFSRHILKRGSSSSAGDTEGGRAGDQTPQKAASVSILSSLTPMLPGGLRLKQWKSSDDSGSVFTSPTKFEFDTSATTRRRRTDKKNSDRTLPPPSYSSVAATRESSELTPGEAHVTMSASSSLNILEEEEPEDVADEAVATPHVLSTGNAAEAPVDVWPPPRESTPPPEGGLRRQSLSMSRASLSAAEEHLEGLNGIDSPNHSSTSSPTSSSAGRDEVRIQIAATSADDSLRATLDEVVSSLQKRKQIRGSVSELDLTRPAKGPVGGLGLSSKQVNGRLESDLDVLAHRLQALSAEQGPASRQQTSQQVVTSTESPEEQRLALATERLQRSLQHVEDEVKAGGPVISSKPSRPWTWLLSATVQVCLFCFSLWVMRNGAERLYRTVYYDAMYSHLYAVDDSSSRLVPLGFMPLLPSSASFLTPAALLSQRASTTMLSLPRWASSLQVLCTVPFRALALLLRGQFTGNDDTMLLDRAVLVPI